MHKISSIFTPGIGISKEWLIQSIAHSVAAKAKLNSRCEESEERRNTTKLGGGKGVIQRCSLEGAMPCLTHLVTDIQIYNV